MNLQEEERDDKPCHQVDAQCAIELAGRVVCIAVQDARAWDIDRPKGEPETTI